MANSASRLCGASRCTRGAPGSSAARQSDDRRQRLVVHRHPRHRILGEVAVVGDNDRHRLADVHGFAAGQRRTVALLPVAGTGQPDDEALVGKPGTQIVQRQYRPHAGQRESGAPVDAAYCCVGMRAAHERRVQHAGQADVVHVAALPPQEREVLQPGDALADDLESCVSHARLPACASPHRARPPRCPRIPCSGRDCPTARPAPPLPSGAGCRAGTRSG